MKKELQLKKELIASIAVGEKLLIPYSNSKVFAAFDNDRGELFILIKDSTNESNSVKLFFKEIDMAEIVKEEDIKEEPVKDEPIKDESIKEPEENTKVEE